MDIMHPGHSSLHVVNGPLIWPIASWSYMVDFRLRLAPLSEPCYDSMPPRIIHTHVTETNQTEKPVLSFDVCCCMVRAPPSTLLFWKLARSRMQRLEELEVDLENAHARAVATSEPLLQSLLAWMNSLQRAPLRRLWPGMQMCALFIFFSGKREGGGYGMVWWCLSPHVSLNLNGPDHEQSVRRFFAALPDLAMEDGGAQFRLQRGSHIKHVFSKSQGQWYPSYATLT